MNLELIRHGYPAITIALFADLIGQEGVLIAELLTRSCPGT
ncbi:hypothetical protein [Trueperella bernardiae]|nr:hypothetical protein [Trueperella bernardiae]